MHTKCKFKCNIRVILNKINNTGNIGTKGHLNGLSICGCCFLRSITVMAITMKEINITKFTISKILDNEKNPANIIAITPINNVLKSGT